MNDKTQADSSDNDTHYIGDELELFSHAKNWKAYWASKIRPLIEEPVLEVGAGIGSNLALLRDKKQDWLALEPDPDQAAEIRETSVDDDNLRVVCGFIDDLSSAQKFQTILYIDVLEHVQFDAAEVERASEHLNLGGRLIILSPAHNALFSPFDKAVGHFRRYNKSLLEKLTPHQLVIKQLYYLDSVGCAASFTNAKLLKSSMPTKGQVLLWDRLMVPLSKLIDKLTLRRFGKTVVMVWEKRS